MNFRYPLLSRFNPLFYLNFTLFYLLFNLIFTSTYRHIRNYYLSNSKTLQDGNGNGNFRKFNSNGFQDGNWESMEMKG